MNITDKLSVANSIIDLQDYSKAINILNEIIEEDANISKVFIDRGYCYHQIGESKNAVADLLKATEINPKEAVAFYYLSQIHSQKGDYNKGKEYIAASLKLDSHNSTFIAELAIIESELKNYASCKELCDQLLAEHPDDANTLNLRGNAFAQLNDHANAMRDHRASLKEDSLNAYTLNDLAFSLSKIGNQKDAFKYFEQAIDVNPNFASAYNNLGAAHYLDNNYDKALQLIEHSIHLDDEDSSAYKNRALVLIATDKKADAKQDLDKAIELGYTTQYDNEVVKLLLQY